MLNKDEVDTVAGQLHVVVIVLRFNVSAPNPITITLKRFKCK